MTVLFVVFSLALAACSGQDSNPLSGMSPSAGKTKADSSGVACNVGSIVPGPISQLTNNGTSYSPAWSPDGQQIAFTTYRDNSYRESTVFVMDADGSNIRQLTNDSSYRWPVWSPDGRYIAFTSVRDDDNDRYLERDVFVMDADGNNPRQLTNDGKSRNPVWSPDGRYIAFTSSAPKGIDIFVMDTNGNNPRQLTNDGKSWVPAWSPDSRYIAFTSYSDQFGGNSDIFVIGVYDDHVCQLTYNGNSEYPDWSPDGQQIVFGYDGDDGPNGAYVMSTDGSNIRQLTYSGQLFTWSPDGQHIVYHNDTGIAVISAEGGLLRQLTNDSSYRSPVWSPDGRYIAFRSYGDDTSDIYTMMVVP